MIWFLVVSGLISSTGKVVSASCELKLNPSKVVVRYGDSLLATCSSPSEIEGIGWESTYEGTGLKKGVSSLPLKIDSVIDWDVQPQCYASLISTGEQCLVNLPVTVYKMPNAVSVLRAPNERGPIVEGQSYELKCEVVDVAPAKGLIVRWYNSSGLIYSAVFDNPSPSPVNLSSELTQVAHRADDGKKIFCVAALNLGLEETSVVSMVSPSLEMSILYPPSFVKPGNETVEIPAGGSEDLNCTAAGNPAPVYSWETPESSQERNQNPDSNVAVLRPAFQLPGIYSCTASNSQGNSTKYFTVIEIAEDRTTFAVILGVFGALGVLLLISGLFIVTPNGTFSFNKGGYIQGQPSGPV